MHPDLQFVALMIFLALILYNQNQLRKGQMANQADLDTALASIETAVQKLGTDLQKTLSDLAAKIAAGSTPADLQPEVDRANAIATSLTSFDTEATTADQS
jgi:hypothetical protein